MFRRDIRQICLYPHCPLDNDTEAITICSAKTKTNEIENKKYINSYNKCVQNMKCANRKLELCAE